MLLLKLNLPLSKYGIETIGYFFCLQDRALLCRKCDVAIHTANSFVSAHQRFLLTGVKVGLEATEPSGASSTNEDSDSVRKTTAPAVSPAAVTPSVNGMKEAVSGHHGGVGSTAANRASLTGDATSGTNVPVWLSQEHLGFTELNQSYGFLDSLSSSKFWTLGIGAVEDSESVL
ncbi:B-box-type zinc finger [Trema orientale]|uniref:B-box-type zinc finger n=1 Tax=Trema orientale TaxID=63057 RepID=A0A2P5EYM9_TREOI|nr:B-box-type zinc finger [Trema orientale]